MLDNPSIMILVISKQPFKLGDKWKSTACDHLEQRGQKETFKDLVDFLEQQARVALDPISRNIQDITPSMKVRKTRVSDPKHQLMSRGKTSSFATTVTSVAMNTTDERGNQESEQKRSITTSVTFRKPFLFCAGDHAMEYCRKMALKLHKKKIEFLSGKLNFYACLT